MVIHVNCQKIAAPIYIIRFIVIIQITHLIPQFIHLDQMKLHLNLSSVLISAAINQLKLGALMTVKIMIQSIMQVVVQ